jgi:hypothetical protein
LLEPAAPTSLLPISRGEEGVKKSTGIVILIPQSREKDLHCFVFKETADASLRSPENRPMRVIPAQSLP